MLHDKTRFLILTPCLKMVPERLSQFRQRAAIAVHHGPQSSAASFLQFDNWLEIIQASFRCFRNILSPSSVINKPGLKSGPQPGLGLRLGLAVRVSMVRVRVVFVRNRVKISVRVSSGLQVAESRLGAGPERI